MYGILYIIVCGVILFGCGNNVIEVEYNEECDYGKVVNGMLDSFCLLFCKCLFGMILFGLCCKNIMFSLLMLILSSSIIFYNIRYVFYFLFGLLVN